MSQLSVSHVHKLLEDLRNAGKLLRRWRGEPSVVKREDMEDEMCDIYTRVAAFSWSQGHMDAIAESGALETVTRHLPETELPRVKAAMMRMLLTFASKPRYGRYMGLNHGLGPLLVSEIRALAAPVCRFWEYDLAVNGADPDPAAPAGAPTTAAPATGAGAGAGATAPARSAGRRRRPRRRGRGRGRCGRRRRRRTRARPSPSRTAPQRRPPPPAAGATARPPSPRSRPAHGPPRGPGTSRPAGAGAEAGGGAGAAGEKRAPLDALSLEVLLLMVVALRHLLAEAATAQEMWEYAAFELCVDLLQQAVPALAEAAGEIARGEADGDGEAADELRDVLAMVDTLEINLYGAVSHLLAPEKNRERCCGLAGAVAAGAASRPLAALLWLVRNSDLEDMAQIAAHALWRLASAPEAHAALVEHGAVDAAAERLFLRPPGAGGAQVAGVSAAVRTALTRALLNLATSRALARRAGADLQWNPVTQWLEADYRTYAVALLPHAPAEPAPAPNPAARKPVFLPGGPSERAAAAARAKAAATGPRLGHGTSLYVTLEGARGSSGERELQLGPHSFPDGEAESFYVDCGNLGALRRVALRLSPPGQKLRLALVTVADEVQGSEYRFPFPAHTSFADPVLLPVAEVRREREDDFLLAALDLLHRVVCVEPEPPDSLAAYDLAPAAPAPQGALAVNPAAAFGLLHLLAASPASGLAPRAEELLVELLDAGSLCPLPVLPAALEAALARLARPRLTGPAVDRLFSLAARCVRRRPDVLAQALPASGSSCAALLGIRLRAAEMLHDLVRLYGQAEAAVQGGLPEAVGEAVAACLRGIAARPGAAPSAHTVEWQARLAEVLLAAVREPRLSSEGRRRLHGMLPLLLDAARLHRSLHASGALAAPLAERLWASRPPSSPSSPTSAPRTPSPRPPAPVSLCSTSERARRRALSTVLTALAHAETAQRIAALLPLLTALVLIPENVPLAMFAGPHTFARIHGAPEPASAWFVLETDGHGARRQRPSPESFAGPRAVVFPVVEPPPRPRPRGPSPPPFAGSAPLSAIPEEPETARSGVGSDSGPRARPPALDVTLPSEAGSPAGTALLLRSAASLPATLAATSPGATFAGRPGATGLLSPSPGTGVLVELSSPASSRARSPAPSLAFALHPPASAGPAPPSREGPSAAASPAFSDGTGPATRLTYGESEENWGYLLEACRAALAVIAPPSRPPDESATLAVPGARVPVSLEAEAAVAALLTALKTVLEQTDWWGRPRPAMGRELVRGLLEAVCGLLGARLPPLPAFAALSVAFLLCKDEEHATVVAAADRPLLLAKLAVKAGPNDATAAEAALVSCGLLHFIATHPPLLPAVALPEIVYPLVDWLVSGRAPWPCESLVLALLEILLRACPVTVAPPGPPGQGAAGRRGARGRPLHPYHEKARELIPALQLHLGAYPSPVRAGAGVGPVQKGNLVDAAALLLKALSPVSAPQLRRQREHIGQVCATETHKAELAAWTRARDAAREAARAADPAPRPPHRPPPAPSARPRA
eukprot:tig00001065_g6719.t1